MNMKELLICYSMQNPVLRSASFHGTAGLTPNYISSEEEEVTLSADEDSPTTGQSLLAAPSSPSKVIGNKHQVQTHKIKILV
jgi:hypothetical protein